jgi:transglutaminase-like putative cysteine protease
MTGEQYIDHDALDWNSVVAVTYDVEQSISYEYDSPIRDLRHRLVVVPRDLHGDQRRLSQRLSVTPQARARADRDPFGNDVVDFAVSHVERSISFALRSQVIRDSRLGPHRVDPAQLRDLALGGVRRLIRVDEELADAAAAIRALYPGAAERAEAIVRFVHREMIYTKAVTDIFTTASVAFRMRRGVCQDYAHVTIAIAHACGLTARYVSGHLLGEGATHAWIEFLLPLPDGEVAVAAFDPTIGRAIDWRYLVVAVGRDYDDVAPSSGVFTGEPTGRLGALQAVRVSAVTLAA